MLIIFYVVFWGGREGYHTLLNTDVKRELDHMGRFFQMVVGEFILFLFFTLPYNTIKKYILSPPTNSKCVSPELLNNIQLSNLL